ncbi:MAG: chromosomal replication initiator protein DnaA [Candidatus Parcubacteria bacterium]|nr:MAG: chromosomal replication initiator protein DnaA [Candidatus Parcubacteria bacterium]
MALEHFQTTWDKILTNIKNNVGESVFKVWFSHFQPKNYSQGVLKIEVPSKFVKDWLEKKFEQVILKTIKEFIPEIKSIELVVSNKPGLEIDYQKTIIKRFSSINQQRLTIFEINPQTNLNPRYRFDNFVVGQGNELAFAACQAVAKNYGKLHNPLFVYGPVGVGKTHLLQATGNEALKLHKNIKLKYLTTEEFTNEFIQSLKNHTTEEFRAKFRDIDILILDDVHFLSGKTTSQEELFHTFNYLFNLSKQIIFSSDRPPKLIPDIEARLRSRFEGGLVIDINPPDYETRMAILKLKSQEKGVVFDDKIYDLIAQRITKNTRELEGALSLIIFHHNQGEKITLEKVEELLKKFSKDFYRKISPKKIVKVIAEHYEIKDEDVFKKTRTKHLVRARQFLIYFLREISQLSYTSIGEFLKKDHTTIIYSYEKIVKELKKNPLLNQELEVLKSKIMEV